jgi:Asp-tRNA(Asn)/Glu-tRNA(Gln) amidotransferase A subunit family amidase
MRPVPSARSCEEIARAAIKRIAEREPVVRAWAHFDADALLNQARALDARADRGLLHGLLLGVKDVIDTADMPTQMGSPIYAGYRPFADASCVALARAAGALIAGKTVTAEFAGLAPGPTTNPLDPARTPGGSSSGSAAAVAAGMITVALGTQTGGSIHRPASYCGIVGFRPTQCLIDRTGVKPAAEFFDTVGLLARSLDEIERVFAVLSNHVAALAEPSQVPVIGVCRTPMWAEAQPETRAAVERAADALRAAGFVLRDVTLPSEFAAIGRARATINDYQRAHAMRYEWETHRELLSPQMQAVIRRGIGLAYDDVCAAFASVARYRTGLAAVFAGVDLLLAPCVDGEAPRGLASTGEHQFQSLWTSLDAPAVSLPAHRGPNGLPVSVQLVGLPLRDRTLLARARRCEPIISGLLQMK